MQNEGIEASSKKVSLYHPQEADLMTKKGESSHYIFFKYKVFFILEPLMEYTYISKQYLQSILKHTRD